MGNPHSPNLMLVSGRFTDPVRSNYAGFDLYCKFINTNLDPTGSSQYMQPEKLNWTIIATGYSRTSIDQIIDTSQPYMPRVPNDVILVKQ